MEKAAIWFYQRYCARSPVWTEIIVGLVALFAIHVGLSYIKQAIENGVSAHSPQPSVIPSNPLTPQILESGHNNEQVFKPEKHNHPSLSKNSGLSQVMIGSPGGMQAGRDLTVIGNIPHPPRSVDESRLKSATDILKTAPPASKVAILQLGASQEISDLVSQLGDLFSTANEKWTIQPLSMMGSQSVAGLPNASINGVTCEYFPARNAAYEAAVNALRSVGIQCGESRAIIGAEIGLARDVDVLIKVQTRIAPE